MTDFSQAFATPNQHVLTKNGVVLDIKRLDFVHPHISGNKFYKLKYNLLQAQQQQKLGVLTFGGAYSNHIAATAYAAHSMGLPSVGVIRGNELADLPLNHTLATAQRFGMQFLFVSRQDYKQRYDDVFLQQLLTQFPHYAIIPEGGTNLLAVQGCMEILTTQDLAQYNVFCSAVGTGGTLAGLIESSQPQHQILGFSALKGNFLQHDVQQFTAKKNWTITDAYCTGGYAKTTPELLAFIEKFEAEYSIPLEPIYTAKMLMGIFDLIEQKHFPQGSKILAIHSGGLQGRQI